MSFRFPVLIGDIGGTNARFAILRSADSPIERLAPQQVERHATIEDAIASALAGFDGPGPATLLFAAATPMVGEEFKLTNADWTIRPARLIAAFNLAEIVLMNDFAAQGLATLALPDDCLTPIGGAAIVDGLPKVAIGPGTGLGIANIVKVAGVWAVIPGEGGHIDLGPRTTREMAIWPHLDTEDGRVSAELALSGRGLENLYRGICAADGHAPALEDAADISAAAISGADAAAREAVDLFVTLFARVAGDMALLTLARGGIYVAGGIILKLLAHIDGMRFRADFEDKGPHQHIMASIPVNVMNHPTAALEGLAAWVRRPGAFYLEGAILRFGR